jgi:hypothetical protein
MSSVSMFYIYISLGVWKSKNYKVWIQFNWSSILSLSLTVFVTNSTKFSFKPSISSARKNGLVGWFFAIIEIKLDLCTQNQDNWQKIKIKRSM